MAPCRLFALSARDLLDLAWAVLAERREHATVIALLAGIAGVDPRGVEPDVLDELAGEFATARRPTRDPDRAARVAAVSLAAGGG